MDIWIVNIGVAKILQLINSSKFEEFLRVYIRLYIIQNVLMDVKIPNIIKPILIIFLIIIIRANILSHKNDLNLALFIK